MPNLNPEQREFIEARRIMGNSFMDPIYTEMHPAHKVFLHQHRGSFSNGKAPATILEKVAAFLHDKNNRSTLFDTYHVDEQKACMKAMLIDNMPLLPQSLWDLESFQMYYMQPRSANIPPEMQDALYENIEDPLLQRLIAINNRNAEIFYKISSKLDALNIILAWETRSLQSLSTMKVTKEYVSPKGWKLLFSLHDSVKQVSALKELKKSEFKKFIVETPLFWWTTYRQALTPAERAKIGEREINQLTIKSLLEGNFDFHNIHSLDTNINAQLLDAAQQIQCYADTIRSGTYKNEALEVVQKITLLLSLYDKADIPDDVLQKTFSTPKIDELELNTTNL